MSKLQSEPQQAESLKDDFELLNFMISFLGQKWFIPVLSCLYKNGELRYSAIQKQQGNISKKTLSYVLQSMERYGLVVRKIKLSHPPQVTYALSERGISLVHVLHPLSTWVQEKYDSLLSDAHDFDERSTKEVRTPWQM